jgi:hypothetical protein
MLREEHENRAKDPFYTLRVRTAGAVFGERCNVRLRIPKERPAHMLLKSLLNSCNKVTIEEVKQAKTFADQLDLLQRMNGWSDTTLGGNVNDIFKDRLSNAGSQQARARATIAVLLACPLFGIFQLIDPPDTALRQHSAVCVGSPQCSKTPRS